MASCIANLWTHYNINRIFVGLTKEDFIPVMSSDHVLLGSFDPVKFLKRKENP